MLTWRLLKHNSWKFMFVYNPYFMASFVIPYSWNALRMRSTFT